MLHLIKLCVGVRDIAHLRQIQAEREVQMPPLRHRTRTFPRRAAEITDGGSIYWVIAGAVVTRQRILDIVEDHWDDSSACTGLILDPELVPVLARPTRPFQGWRYLEPDAAPADIALSAAARGEGALPVSLRRELRSLCLL